jgi:hypothetical protein
MERICFDREDDDSEVEGVTMRREAAVGGFETISRNDLRRLFLLMAAVPPFSA